MSLQDTLHSTPQPSAWSTETKREPYFNKKREVKKNLYQALNSSSESLGILSLEDMKSKKDNSLITSDYLSQSNNEYLHSLEERRKAQERTRALLDKLNNRYSLSNGQTRQLFESTVNDSDLLKETQIVTDKSNLEDSSTVNESDLLRDSSLSFIAKDNPMRNNDEDCNASRRASKASESLSAYIEDLKQKFKANSTASFSDIVADHTKHSFRQSDLNLDSAMFHPAGEMKDQFEEDEKAWRQKYASIPNISRTSFSSLQTSFDDKISMGEFFRGKSDDCSIFGKSSPIKDQPIPLVNSTSIEDDDHTANCSVSSILSNRNDDQLCDRSVSSVLSLTNIRNLITEEEATPSKLVERLLNPHSQSKQKESYRSDLFNNRISLGSPKVNSPRFSKQYASSNDLREPPSPSPGKMYSTKSLGHISNKENFSQTTDEKNRTLTSLRSTSSCDSIPEVITKLASTKSELVWGCVKEGRSQLQDVTIRNKNNRRVKYVIQSNNPNFKLVNVDLQGDKGLIHLHPLETRQIQVSFAPNSTGPQVGQLLFTPIFRREEQIANRQHISLYGYGGHVNIDIKGQTRDLCGKLWVSLGCVDGRQQLSADFIVRNTGTIDGFVCFTVASKSLAAYEDIVLEPAKFVVRHGGGEQSIRVTFRPSKNDLHLLNASLTTRSMKAAEIAVIRMITGADINRQRIVKLQKKVVKDFDVNVQDALGQQLCSDFEGAARSEEVRYFNESVKSVKTLMQCLESTEISLLVDRDMDATLMPEVDDSSVVFKTMVCPDDTTTLDRGVEHSYVRYFNVELTKIILTPPSKCRDFILLSSNYHRSAIFKINVLPADILRIAPMSGEVTPGEIVKVMVSCNSGGGNAARQDVKVVIEIEEDALSVIVSILHL